MAFSKAYLFEKKQFTQSQWSKAISHPARIIILDYLLEHGTTSFAQLKKLVPLAPTTLSQHLRCLRQNNLITPSEKFPHTYYTINKEYCGQLAMLLIEYHEPYLL